MSFPRLVASTFRRNATKLVTVTRGIMVVAFDAGSMGDDDREQESDLDDPLAELVRIIEAGTAEVYVDEMPWGEQARIDYGDYDLADEDPLVSPEEADMNAVLHDREEMVREMIESGEEEWDGILDAEGIEDERRREQWRTVARDALE